MSGKDKFACDIALQLIEFNKVEIVETEGKTVDQSIINLANENRENIVCTLDIGVRNYLPRVILINRYKRLIITK